MSTAFKRGKELEDDRKKYASEHEKEIFVLDFF